MRVSRRQFLTAGVAASALAAPFVGGLGARAAPGAPNSTQNAGWYRFSLGEFEITILSDGNLTTPTALIGDNVDRDQVKTFLNERFLSTETNYAHTNHVLIDTGAAKVLVDVGSGERFQPTAGRLLSNLAASGLDPSAITHVALTHAHPDHVWGMLDEFDELRFPEAAYAISAAEFDWWTAKGRVDEVPEAMQAMVVGAQNALTPVAEKTTMLKGDGDIVPGVRMISTPGHTAGHMSLMVESAGQTMLVTGDALNHPYVSFERPNWHFGFDIDKAQASKTRVTLLDMLATDRVTLVGYHMPFPGVGHAAKIKGAQDSYRFVAAPWLWGG